jgi:hypothetical protein
MGVAVFALAAPATGVAVFVFDSHDMSNPVARYDGVFGFVDVVVVVVVVLELVVVVGNCWPNVMSALNPCTRFFTSFSN